MKAHLAALLIAGVFLSGGCASSRQAGSAAQGALEAGSQADRPGYDYGQIARIERGQTTEAQLLQWFGPPDDRTLQSNGVRNLAWRWRGGVLQVGLGPDDKVRSYAARRAPSEPSSQPRGYDDRLIAGIQRGETTKAQLVKWFGAPDFQAMKADGGGEMAWNFASRTDGGSGRSGKLKASLARDGTVDSYSARRGPQ